MSSAGWIVVALVATIVIIVNLLFWAKVHRMMDDVHRIAEALAPERKRKPPELERDELYREFRDEGTTKAKR